MPLIHVLPDDKIISIDENETILHALLRSDIPIAHSCNGKGRCSTCRIMILEGIEHLISENGYSDVMRFLDSIVPVVATSKGILIVPVDEHTLSLQDYSLMARQMKMLG